jgi:hypothetical protein
LCRFFCPLCGSRQDGRFGDTPNITFSDYRYANAYSDNRSCAGITNGRSHTYIWPGNSHFAGDTTPILNLYTSTYFAANSHTDGDGYRHCHRFADGYTYRFGYTNANANTDRGSDGNSHTDAQ